MGPLTQSPFEGHLGSSPLDKNPGLWLVGPVQTVLTLVESAKPFPPHSHQQRGRILVLSHPCQHMYHISLRKVSSSHTRGVVAHCGFNF